MGIGIFGGHGVKKNLIGGKTIIDFWGITERDLEYTVRYYRIPTLDSGGYQFTATFDWHYPAAWYRLRDILPHFPLDDIVDESSKRKVIENLPKALKDQLPEDLKDKYLRSVEKPQHLPPTYPPGLVPMLQSSLIDFDSILEKIAHGPTAERERLQRLVDIGRGYDSSKERSASVSQTSSQNQTVSDTDDKVGIPQDVLSRASAIRPQIEIFYDLIKRTVKVSTSVMQPGLYSHESAKRSI